MGKIISSFTINGVAYVTVKFKGAACVMTEREYNQMYRLGKGKNDKRKVS